MIDEVPKFENNYKGNIFFRIFKNASRKIKIAPNASHFGLSQRYLVSSSLITFFEDTLDTSL